MRVVLSVMILCGAGMVGCKTTPEQPSSEAPPASPDSSSPDASSPGLAPTDPPPADAPSTPESGTSASMGAASPDASRPGAASMGDDAAFLKMVAETNFAEIAVGKLAVARAGSAAVKQYGQRMIDDHTKANDEVMKLAQSKSIMLPTEPDAEHKAMADKLSTLSGASFDAEFMKGMHADHAKVVAMFEDKSKNASDADVRAFASKTLPTLQQHLQSAGALHDKHKNVGR